MGAIGKVLSSPAFGKTVTAIGTVATAAGQIQAGRREAEAIRTNIKIDQFNAAISRQEAELVEAKKGLEVRRLRRQKKKILSTQRALFSKAGVLFEGSPLEVMSDTEEQAELDILISQFNRDIEKNRFLSEAQAIEAGVAVRAGEAETAERVGRLEAGRTILTGLSKITAFRR
jgi:hypothetical protein